MLNSVEDPLLFYKIAKPALFKVCVHKASLTQHMLASSGLHYLGIHREVQRFSTLIGQEQAVPLFLTGPPANDPLLSCKSTFWNIRMAANISKFSLLWRISHFTNKVHSSYDPQLAKLVTASGRKRKEGSAFSSLRKVWWAKAFLRVTGGQTGTQTLTDSDSSSWSPRVDCVQLNGGQVETAADWEFGILLKRDIPYEWVYFCTMFKCSMCRADTREKFPQEESWPQKTPKNPYGLIKCDLFSHKGIIWQK